MSDDDMVEWHSRLYRDNPDQRHFNGRAIGAFFGALENPGRVVEIGGWDGALADAMLKDTPSIESWDNYEICREICDLQKCSDPRYRVHHARIVEPPSCDTLVCSHVIEHMSEDEVTSLLDATDAAALYLDTPALSGDWSGSTSFHVLRWNRTELNDAVEARGFRMLDKCDTAWWYLR
jgi:hypothetical protein